MTIEEHKYETIWKPLPDITTFELAQCIPYIFSKLHSIDEWDALDESVTRHFEVSVYNYGEMIREVQRKSKDTIEKLGKLFAIEDEDDSTGPDSGC